MLRAARGNGWRLEMAGNSFGARGVLEVGGRSYEIFRLGALGSTADVSRLPFSLKILLENLLRREDGSSVRAADVEALARFDPAATQAREIAFSPARVLLQDFTGVPAVVDLAAMRDAMVALGGDPARINPLVPAELVIDHSVIADVAGRPDAFARNAELEFERNRERYAFLRWGQQAFDSFQVVPPDTGIVHQVNLEYLAKVVFVREGTAYPDTVVGTDSHTPMVNGLGVLGGGVGKFVEFYGPGVGNVPVENRATIGNMSPEYGSTVAIFPVDGETLRYLEFTGRSPEQIALVEAYTKEQGLFHDPDVEPIYSERIELDLSTVVPSLAGPTRPQDRIALTEAKAAFRRALAEMLPAEQAAGAGATAGAEVAKTAGPDEASAESFPASDAPAVSANGDPAPGEPVPGWFEPDPTGVSGRANVSVPVRLSDGTGFDLDHGDVVIAAITSCTNTSNPSVMIAAGLLAKKAVERGLQAKPWVKTSLAPGSKVVMDYYQRAGLVPYLEKLGFHLVGYGCTTCIGNSGPLAPEVSAAIDANDLVVCSVLSGNRNFEGRINPDCRMNYLASPPLVVAYALAGTMDLDIINEPLGVAGDGSPVHLRDLWPTGAEVAEVIGQAVQSDMFRKSYAAVFEGDEQWRSLEVPGDSTYVRRPPYFIDMPSEPKPLRDVHGARVLAVLGDSVTTDHISPAGVIKRDSPAGRYLIEHGVEVKDFNSYGARRGNHEVMIRGTFANIRLRNRLAPGTEGGVTLHQPDGEQMTIYDAAMRYQQEGVPLVVLAGKEYGSGSSRDWAAKGPLLLGVRAVLASSYERIHRSNLVGMGILPLEFEDGASVGSLGLTGHETFEVVGLEEAGADAFPREVTVRADGKEFRAKVRIDTPNEAEYFRHGGILQFVLRQLRG